MTVGGVTIINAGCNHAMMVSMIFLASEVLFWFSLGAIINSNRYLPQAIMAGSVMYLVFSMSQDHSQAVSVVMDFIDANEDLLLSIALDRWFAANSIEFNVNTVDSLDLREEANRQHVYEGLIEELTRIRAMGKDMALAPREADPLSRLSVDVPALAAHMSGSSSVRSHSFQAKQPVLDIRKFAQLIRTWKYARVTCQPNRPFFFTRDGVSNVDCLADTNVSLTEARLVDVAEARQNQRAIDELLVGSQVAVLKDGLKYGPKMGYIIGSPPFSEDVQFEFAIMLTAQYPPAEHLPEAVKIFLIFDRFDREQSGLLSSQDIARWRKCLGKQDAQHAGMFQRGCDTLDFRAFSSMYVAIEELDHDFEACYSPVDDFSDRFGGTALESGLLHGDKHGTGEYNMKRQKLKLLMDRSLNAQKLQCIYHYSTSESTFMSDAIRKVLSSKQLMALKIHEVQRQIMAPVFGEHVYSDNAKSHASCSPDEFTKMLRFTHFDVVKTMLDTYKELHTQVLDKHVVETTVTRFFDSIVASEVQLKAQRLTDSVRPLFTSGMSPDAQTCLAWSTPCCTMDIMTAMSKFNLSHKAFLQKLTFHAQLLKGGPSDFLAMVVATIFHKCHVVLSCDVHTHWVAVLGEGGNEERFELKRFAENSLHDLCVAQIRDLLAQGTAVVEFSSFCIRLAKSTLTFAGFILLLVMCGVRSARNVHAVHGNVSLLDLSPAEKTKLEMQVELFVASRSFGDNRCTTKKGERDLKIEFQNLLKLRKVFNDLSNNAGLLPTHLVDEAVAVVSGGNLTFGGCMACFKYLGAGLTETGVLGTASGLLGGMGYANTLVLTSEQMKKADGNTQDRMRVQNILQTNHGYESALDWNRLELQHSWPSVISTSFEALATSNQGFVGRAQVLQMVEDLRTFYVEESASHTRIMLEQMSCTLNPETLHHEGLAGRQATESPQKASAFEFTRAESLLAGQLQDVAGQQQDRLMVSFDTFVALMKKLGYLQGSSSSLLIWIIMACDLQAPFKMMRVKKLIKSFKRLRARAEAHLKKHNCMSDSQRTTLLALLKKRVQLSVSGETNIPCYLPAVEAFDAFLRNLMMPVLDDGTLFYGYKDIEQRAPRVWDKGLLTKLTPLRRVHDYRGAIILPVFRAVVRRCRMANTEAAALSMWQSLPKDPLDVSDTWPLTSLDDEVLTTLVENAEALSDAELLLSLEDLHGQFMALKFREEFRPPRYMRMGMHPMGMDPTWGLSANTATVRTWLPRMMGNGLSQEGLFQLLRSSLNMRIERLEFNMAWDRFLESYDSCFNEFGLLKLEDVETFVRSSSAEGLAFPALNALVKSMQLRFPSRDVKRMFDYMDVNQDGALDIYELLGGFEILISQFMPPQIVNVSVLHRANAVGWFEYGGSSTADVADWSADRRTVHLPRLRFYGLRY